MIFRVSILFFFYFWFLGFLCFFFFWNLVMKHERCDPVSSLIGLVFVGHILIANSCINFSRSVIKFDLY